jgi:hypothetical protein
MDNKVKAALLSNCNINYNKSCFRFRDKKFNQYLIMSANNQNFDRLAQQHRHVRIKMEGFINLNNKIFLL